VIGQRSYDLAVRVTHEPTGESVTLTRSSLLRSERALVEAAKAILAARLRARRMDLPAGEREACVYDLPDSDHDPHNLDSYRLPIGSTGL
jgi:protein subunit release factor A